MSPALTDRTQYALRNLRLRWPDSMRAALLRMDYTDQPGTCAPHYALAVAMIMDECAYAVPAEGFTPAELSTLYVSWLTLEQRNSVVATLYQMGLVP